MWYCAPGTNFKLQSARMMATPDVLAYMIILLRSQTNLFAMTAATLSMHAIF